MSLSAFPGPTSSQTEEWKSIPEYPGYLVSSLGRVTCKKSNKLLKPVICNGYCVVRLRNKDSHKVYKLHRLVAHVFLDPPEESKTQVNHIDRNQLNNSVSNLEWVSPAENFAHYQADNASKNKCVKAQKIAFHDEDTGDMMIFNSYTEVCRYYGLAAGTIWGTIKDIHSTGIKYKGYKIYLLDDDYNVMPRTSPGRNENLWNYLSA